MSDEAEVIDLTDKYRIVVYYDTDAQNPREDWEMITGAVTVEHRWNTIDVVPVHNDPTGRIKEAHERLDVDDVIRWARIWYDVTLEWDQEHGCYWFCDAGAFTENWPELTGEEKVAKEHEVIAQEQETYRQWAEGEVYGVALQKQVAYALLTEDETDLAFIAGDTVRRYEWEDVESLWGCYLDDTYTAQAVVRDNFSTDDPELAKALGGGDDSTTNTKGK